jgi:hypothetical protein
MKFPFLMEDLQQSICGGCIAQSGTINVASPFSKRFHLVASWDSLKSGEGRAGGRRSGRLCQMIVFPGHGDQTNIPGRSPEQPRDAIALTNMRNLPAVVTWFGHRGG